MEPVIGDKFDQAKVRYDLVPPHALEEVAKVLTFGSLKYSDDNWKKVEELQRRYMAAALRHIEAHRRGQSNDEESGLPHLAHAATCLMFILEDMSE